MKPQRAGAGLAWSRVWSRALVWPWLLAGCGTEPAPRPNLLLVVVDTLRQDRVSIYGSAAGTTPHLDELAAEGWWFDGVNTPRAKTTPAVASLFTGLYPWEHGVRDLSVPLPAALPTLAEALRGADYHTAAIVGNFVLVRRRAALDRGFDTWIEDLPQVRGVPPHDAPQRVASSLTDGALAALGLGAPSADGAGPEAPVLPADQPWFLYLHYMDPHGAYEPPPEHRLPPTETDPVPASVAPSGHLRPRIADYNIPDSARRLDGGFDAAQVRALYDGEVRYVDAELGRLFAALRAAGQLDRTWVVVTADHGESLGEHLYWFEHGYDAYEVSMRVPLLLRPPAHWRGSAPRGLLQGDLSLADLAPTLIELLGLPPLPHGRTGTGPRGRSQAPWLLEGRGPTEPVFVSKTERADLFGAVQLEGVRRSRWKWLEAFTFEPGPEGAARRRTVRQELYDLQTDPGELRDLSAAPPEAAPLGALRADLERLFAADAGLHGEALELQAARERLEAESPGDVQMLRALGYR